MNISGTEVEIVQNLYASSVVSIDREYDDATTSLLVKGRWNRGILDFMRQQNLTGLYLNSAKGFSCANFDFLYDLPELKLLHLICPPVDSLAPIEQLNQLKSLNLSCYWHKRLNLAGLQALERSFVAYAKGAETIFECAKLRYLYVDGFPAQQITELAKLTCLEYLTIGNSGFNRPEQLAQIKLLRKLVLLNCRKLNHLTGVERLEHLEWLTIDGSRLLNSIHELSSLKSLKVLQLSDNKELQSLAPIKELTQLKALCFFGDTVFTDGDFSFLEEFQALSLVGFTGRRHYTHKPARSWNWNDYEAQSKGLVRKK